MIIYAATVVLSACLLFLVQPLITKMIFPWFGGTAAVWITALMFFQVCLLCGYSYAHWLIARVSPKRQTIIHCALLLAACAMLPVIPSDAWRPHSAGSPVLRIFLLLAANVGLPCLALSATSPLLQAWYMRERGSQIPLWLFALSNFGSLAALLSFPLLLEPEFATRTLAIAWSIGFAIFVALCLVVAWTSRNATAVQPTTSAAHSVPPDVGQMTLWVLFSACASALLAAATVQLSTNVAPIPLLWVVPLAVYLLTFILNFGSPRFYRRRIFFPLVAAAIGGLAWLYVNSEAHQDIRYVIPLYLACLFIVCMACHGEIVQRAPEPAYLTRFYLLIALGGALGGVFVGVIAPLAFDSYLELPVLLIVLAELMIITQWQRKGAGYMLWPVRIAMIAGLAVLAGSLLLADVRNRGYNVVTSRNFYGVLLVREYEEGGLKRRSLVHGTIRHGYQFVDAEHRDIPASYYGHPSGVGRALRVKQQAGPVRVGVIGLGAGILTSYARRGDTFVVYEINEDVVRLAEHEFSFLSAARARGADLSIAMGDA
ncbi:MAG TPA: hypothetical protein VKB34_02910, partial [Povalibacter sp.]|nr:hypothetical protein [Povalibacter sp.]